MPSIFSPSRSSTRSARNKSAAQENNNVRVNRLLKTWPRRLAFQTYKGVIRNADYLFILLCKLKSVLETKTALILCWKPAVFQLEIDYSFSLLLLFRCRVELWSGSLEVMDGEEKPNSVAFSLYSSGAMWPPIVTFPQPLLISGRINAAQVDADN